jgi:hypothetical protein
MKAGNIVKISAKGMNQLAPTTRSLLENEIGLVVESEYKYAHKTIRGEKTFASLVCFPSQKGDLMFFPDEVEVIS